VQPLEHAKQFLGIFRIETSAVIANENHCFDAFGGSTTDFDSDLGAASGELYRIGNQIDKH
jgi:hypothetical protein